MKILFKFPSRSRPEKFFKTLKNIILNTVDWSNYLISATLDENDLTMNNDSVKEKLKTEYPLVEVWWGRSRNKVDAINRDVNISYDWDIIVLVSDDMEFIAYGFDDMIRRDFKLEESLDRVIHYTDGFDHDPIISLPVLGREWYNHWGYIYNPVYVSLFCDEELYLVAKQLGKLYTSDFKIVRHNHPAWIGGIIDPQLKSSQSFHPIDKITFERRKRNNFFLK